jgi:hypothetical protein
VNAFYYSRFNIVKNCLTNSNLLAFLCQSGLVAGPSVTIIFCTRFCFGDFNWFWHFLSKKGYKLILESGNTIKKTQQFCENMEAFVTIFGGKIIVAATLTHWNKNDNNRSSLRSGFMIQSLKQCKPIETR